MSDGPAAVALVRRARTVVDGAGADGLDFVRAVLLAHAAVVATAPWVSEVGSVGSELAGPGTARAWGAGRRSPSDAALLNGWRAHLRAQDDTFPEGTVHPGAAVVPAAVATAEAIGASGRALCDAVLAGYEVACAASLGVRNADRAQLRTSSMFPPLGAAAAAAVVRGASDEEVAQAIGFAAATSGGLSQTWLTGGSAWAYQLGHAASTGVDAAVAAATGVFAGYDLLEADLGLWPAMGLTPALGDLADGSIAQGGVTLKPHAACEVLQGPVEAALALRRPGVELRHVEVRLSEREATYAGILGRPPFASRGEVLLSAAACVAVALEHGDLALADLLPDRIDELAPTIERVDVLGDAGVPFGSTQVRVEWADGVVDGTTVAAEARQATWSLAVDIAEQLRAEVGLASGAFDDLVEVIGALPDADPADVSAALDAACLANDRLAGGVEVR